MSLDNYSLGSQDSGFAIVFCLRVEGWLRMNHFCLLSCLVVAELPTSLRKISAKSWFDNQQDNIVPLSCGYLRSIQYPYFLHSIDHDLLLQDSDSIYLLLQRNYTPELYKTKIDISYLKFFPRKFLIGLFETIIDCLYHFCCAQSEHSCYMSVITMLRSIIHLNLK